MTDWEAHLFNLVSIRQEQQVCIHQSKVAFHATYGCCFSSRKRIADAVAPLITKEIQRERRRIARNGRRFLRRQARRGFHYERDGDGMLREVGRD